MPKMPKFNSELFSFRFGFLLVCCVDVVATFAESHTLLEPEEIISARIPSTDLLFCLHSPGTICIVDSAQQLVLNSTQYLLMSLLC